jgi:hypothetical protein
MYRLSDKAMLVRLSISQWTARKYDRVISNKVANDYNAPQDAGRYNKCLIAQSSLKAIVTISGEARTFHYANTLPWDDSDNRLLPAANYLDYTSKMRDLRARFESAVSDFIASYPSLVDEAKITLAGMFDPTDYPHISEIPRRYSFNVSVSPLPESSDFRVTLQSEDIAQIKADLESRAIEAQSRAMTELWQRTYDAVKHLCDKLSDGKAIFRDSLIENISELVNLLPKLNILDDVNLEAARQNIEAQLIREPSDLRTDQTLRQTVASEAAGILATMSSYMGNSGS